MILWPDLVSVYVRCIVLHEFILICVVLGLFMLIASKCMFSHMLLWLYKLILNPVNFLTVCTICARFHVGLLMFDVCFDRYIDPKRAVKLNR
jgi:hypothetical protein